MKLSIRLMDSTVSYTVTQDTAVITIANPPVNALSHPVRIGLIEMLDRAQCDAEARAIIIICTGKTFIAGADIREFGQPPRHPVLQDVQEHIELSSKTVVAAMHGTALGGGFELSMCCHYRVGIESLKLGLPEVTLGLLPGGGGTQRLPRLVGAQAALDLMLTGKPITAQQALGLGALDAVFPTPSTEILLEQAIEFALARVDQPLLLVRDNQQRIAGTDTALFDEVRKENKATWHGKIAPQRIVDCVEVSCTTPFEAGKQYETNAFNVLRESAQSKALRYAFFAQREATKIPGLAAGVSPQSVNTAAVIGAGTMGGGIAMCFANAGIPVFLVDVSPEALTTAMQRIRSNYDVSVGRGSLARSAADKAVGLITPTTSYSQIANVDAVIEAVFESLPLKKQIFSELDKTVKQGALLASNTSALDIDQIAAATSRPDDVLGTHFFSPAHIMKLQENVRGKCSSEQTIANAMQLAKQLGKVAVLAGNCDGFIGNRISAVYSRECDFLLEEGATPWQIDNALKAFGFPMGVYLMKDMAGLDIGWQMRKNREPNRDKSLRYSTVADRICEMGRFGQKTAAGYYRYEDKQALPDPAIEELIVSIAEESGIERRKITEQEIIERVLCAMANEGAKVLGDGMALRASDIDVIYLFGFGFPRYRGGPMFWAEQQGLDKVLATVNRYYQQLGPYWEPAQLLVERAGKGSWSEPAGSQA
jgi:3-hydroxyacyl-CoA dehydrogenase